MTMNMDAFTVLADALGLPQAERDALLAARRRMDEVMPLLKAAQARIDTLLASAPPRPSVRHPGRRSAWEQWCRQIGQARAEQQRLLEEARALRDQWDRFMARAAQLEGVRQ